MMSVTIPIPEVGQAVRVRYNYRRFGVALKNDQFFDHFASRQTFCFWADHLTSTPEIIVMLDADAGEDHGGGTTEGCWRFMEMVRDTQFPGLYQRDAGQAGRRERVQYAAGAGR
jgi:hypothetical protein